MSKSAHQSPPPSPPRKYDAALDDERSAVRVRPPHAPRPSSSGEHALAARETAADTDRRTLPSVTRDLVEQSERLERKLRFARVVLRMLPSDDSRARLLRTAITRRDEVLLDCVLHVLDAGGDLPESPSNDAPPRAISAAPSTSRRPLTLLPPAPDPDAPAEPEDFD